MKTAKSEGERQPCLLPLCRLKLGMGGMGVAWVVVLGLVGQVGAFWVHSSSPDTAAAAPDLVDIMPSCPVAGPRKRGCLLQPVSGCPLQGSFSPPFYTPIPLSLLAPVHSTHSHT